jgi:hypothetical protein
MKPSLLSDFTVSVKYQMWEESPEVADFYRGIYSVTLNFLVTVMFVPEFEKTVDNWPPILPENVDEVTTELEARLFTVALSDYSVTPNSRMKGHQERISPSAVTEDIQNSDNVPENVVIFYVSPEEFEIFSQELSVLAEQTPGVHDYVRISEIESLKFAKFILSWVRNSHQFAAEHVRILGREYEYAQRNIKESRR